MIARREFLGALAGAAAAWPLAARTQQAERMRLVGVLTHATPDEPDMQAQLAAFLQGLERTGWEVGSGAVVFSSDVQLALVRFT